MQYRIYGNHKEYGWKLIETVYSEEDVNLFLSTVIAHDTNYEYGLVVQHNEELNQDEVYTRKREQDGFNK